MTRKERYDGIVAWFRENAAGAKSELMFENPYQLLVAVVLSAQCTDKRVNMVTPRLFERFPSVAALAEADETQILELVRSVSYPNSKTRHLSALARKIQADFGGEIPSTVEELMTLPGVGRKTANVLTSIVYNNPVIAVDTHVFRVSRRIGLSKGSTPEAVEEDLEKNIPVEHRAEAHHWLILHGRYVCTARNPRCSECGIRPFCASAPEGSKSSAPSGR